MSCNESAVCRLCFASEGENSDSIFTDIQRFLPFLDSLAGVSYDKDMPKKICSNCEYQIETTQLLRKRVQFTELVWAQCKRKKTQLTSDLFLNCHVCGCNFDYQGLQAHISAEHGEDHLVQCDICRALVSFQQQPAVSPPDDTFPTGNFDEPMTEYDPMETDWNENEEGSVYEADSYVVEGPDDDESRKAYHKCIYCGTTFDTESDGLQHIELNHKNETPLTVSEFFEKFAIPVETSSAAKCASWKCGLCPKTIHRIDNLRRHFRIRHKIEIPKKKYPSNFLEYCYPRKPRRRQLKNADKQCVEADQASMLDPGHGAPGFAKIEVVESNIENIDETLEVTEPAEVSLGKIEKEASAKYGNKTFYECKLCGKSSDRKFNLERHLMQIHWFQAEETRLHIFTHRKP